MRLQFVLLVAICLANPSFTSPIKSYQDVGEVVYVTIIMRHGERTPELPTYTNDPYADSSYWPEGFHVVTNEGKMHEFQMGQWLRERYSHLFRSEYPPDIIRAQSKNSNISLMSILSVLAGMFLPDDFQSWGPINWQPVPVHSIPDKSDNILGMTAACPAYDDLLNDALKSDDVKNIIDKYQDIFDYVSDRTGDDYNTLSQMKDLYVNLAIQELRNLTLPEWTGRVFPEPLRTIAGQDFITNTLTTKMKKMYSGNLLGEVMDNFDDKVNGKLSPNRNISLYLSNDHAVSSFLNTLSIFNELPPPFSCAALFELHYFSGEYFVTASYKNSTADPFPLVIPNCDDPCPFDDFKDNYKDLIPNNWDHECNN